MTTPARVYLSARNPDGSFNMIEADDVALATGGGGFFVWLKEDESEDRTKFFLPMHSIDTIEYQCGGAGKSDAMRDEKKDMQPSGKVITEEEFLEALETDEPITLEVQNSVIGTTSTTP